MSKAETTEQTTEPNTVIWSGEHRAYWRPEGCGYTGNVHRAGIWSYKEAERMTRHFGPEKGIELRLKHEIPEVILHAAKKERAAYNLWKLFYPGASNPRELWQGHSHQDRFRMAVDQVLEDLK